MHVDVAPSLDAPSQGPRCDPELEQATRRAATPVEVLRLRAARQPARVPLTFYGDFDEPPVHVSYADLDRDARRVAALLQNLVEPGERVLLALPPGPLYNAAFWGCLYAGVIAVPVYPPFNATMASRVSRIAADCDARVALTDAMIDGLRRSITRHAPDAAEQRWIRIDGLAAGSESLWSDPRSDPEALAFLQYTSGSTGDPKGVQVSHGNLQANLLSCVEVGDQVYGIDPKVEYRGGKDRGLNWLPPYHDMGLTAMLIPVWGGGYSIQCSPTWFVRRPERWLREVSARRVAVTGGPNFAYEMVLNRAHMLADDDLDLSCWQAAISGAEPVRPDTLRRFCAAFERFGFDPKSIFPSYGMAEATLYISARRERSPAIIRKLDRDAYTEGRVVLTGDDDGLELVGCGVSAPCQDLLIVDPETRRVCASNAVGEIWVRGPHVAGGYWNRPALNDEVFGATLLEPPAGVAAGPYLRTGDFGFVLDGEVFISGRLKDVIIVRGKKHHPSDLEFLAERACDKLLPAAGAAFSVPDDDGERLVMVHEAVRDVDVNDAFARIREALLREHGIPLSQLVLLGRHTILRTSSGKVQRRAVKAAFLDGTLKAKAETPWPPA